MKQQGFSLLEIIVAIVLIGLIMTVLLSGFSQFVTGIGFIDRAMQLQTKRIIISRVLQRDISGIFVPQCVLNELRKAAQPEQKPQPKDEPAAKMPQQAETAAQSAIEKETSPVLEGYLFKASGPGDTLNELRFYSCNALQGYWTEQIGTAKTRVMEVHYELKEAEQSNGIPLYTLVRRERIAQPCVPADKQQKLGREVVIASNVVRMSGTFITMKRPEKSKQKDQKEANEKQQADETQVPQVLPLVQETSFEREPQKLMEQLKAGEKNMPPLLPDAIELTITLQDTAGVAHELSLFVYILAHPTLDQEPKQPEVSQQGKQAGVRPDGQQSQGGPSGVSPNMQPPI